MTDFQRAAQHPASYRQVLTIDTDSGYRRLSDVLDDWQGEDFATLDESWRAVAGHPDAEPQYQRAWLERPRGHSKTSDLAISATWPLIFARRPISGVAVAADRDQARLLRDCIGRLAHCNTFIGKALQVDNWKVSNRVTGSALEIMSSDVGSSYGILPDFIVMDEVVHWPRRELFDSLLSSGAKRSNCLVLCISNAGFLDSWQFNLREAIKADDSWYFSRLDGPQASWLSDDRLAEQQRLLPDTAFRRLWLNIWSSGIGDAVTEDDIQKAITLEGPMTGSEPDAGQWLFFAGVDLGLRKDATAVAIVARHVGGGYYQDTNVGVRDEWGRLVPKREYHRVEPTYRFRLADLHVWRPQGGRVSLEDVRQTILESHRRFGLAEVRLDPFQAEHLGELLRRDGLTVNLSPQTGPTLNQQATTFIEAFQQRAVELFHDETLLADIRALQLQEKSYGVRLVSPRTSNEGDQTAHGDTASALSIGLRAAVEGAEHPRRDLAHFLELGFFD